MATPSPQKKVKLDSLNQLKKKSEIVADTGDFLEIQKYSPADSTTNPSLIIQAVQKPQYQSLIQEAVDESLQAFKELKSQKPKQRGRQSQKKQEEQINQPTFDIKQATQIEKQFLLQDICERVSVKFGVQISQLVPGLVSTEVDARTSFDKLETIRRAKKIISLYQNYGVDKDRVLIKIAATWEGIKAAEQLKKDKINCNLTLIFNYTQAIACAQADVYLISPFVGRILDYYKENNKNQDFQGKNDPGGASFRNIDQILNLAGCDKLTISPKLLEDLQSCNQDVSTQLSQQDSKLLEIQQVNVDEKLFRLEINNDPMANEKLADGIRKFATDIEKLEQIVLNLLKPHFE